MKINVLLLVVIMTITAITAQSAVKNSTGGQLIEKAKNAVKHELKDPDSAQFRNVHIKRGFEGVVQGEVNAKNSYGGYIGFDKFYYDKKTGEVDYEKAKLKFIEESPKQIEDGLKSLHGSLIENDQEGNESRGSVAWAEKNLSRALRNHIQLFEKAKTNYKPMFVDGW